MMKLQSVLVFALILSTAAPQAAWSAGNLSGDQAFNPVTETPNYDDVTSTQCADACAEYKATVFEGDGVNYPRGGARKMRMSYVVNKCGAIPTNGEIVGSTSATAIDMEKTPIDDNFSTGTTWDECFTTIKSNWTQLADHCDAMDMQDYGRDVETVALVFYATAAASCGLACAAESTPAGGFLRGLCVGTTIAAAGSDIIGTAILYSQAQDTINYGADAASLAVGGVGAAAGGVLAITMSALNNANSSLNQSSSCPAFGLMTVAAIIKGVNRHVMNDTANAECREIVKFTSTVTAYDPSLEKKNTEKKTPDGSQSKKEVKIDPRALASNGKGAGNGFGGVSSRVQGEIDKFPNSPMFSAASARDTFAPVYNALDKSRFKDALQQGAGMNIKDLAGKLAGGQSLSQALSGNSALEPTLASIKQLEKDVANGKLKIKGQTLASGSYASKGGGAKSDAKPNPFGMLGMRGPTSIDAAAPAEAQFEKAKRDLAALPGETTDIWHEGFGGSIFQIVSGKLTRARERVDQLEWETPLNRALTGLPSKKAAGSQFKQGGVRK